MNSWAVMELNDFHVDAPALIILEMPHSRIRFQAHVGSRHDGCSELLQQARPNSTVALKRFLPLVKMSPCLQGIALIFWRSFFAWCPEPALICQQRVHRKCLCKVFYTNEVDVCSCLKANLIELKCDDLQCRHSVRFFFFLDFSNLPLRFAAITGPEPHVILLLVAWESCT